LLFLVAGPKRQCRRSAHAGQNTSGTPSLRNSSHAGQVAFWIMFFGYTLSRTTPAIPN